MAERFTVQNIAVAILTASVLFMGRWVPQTDTNIALIEQRITAEELARKADYIQFRKDLLRGEENANKMSETMANLDKTLSLLVDRLDRGDITVRESRVTTPLPKF